MIDPPPSAGSREPGTDRRRRRAGFAGGEAGPSHAIEIRVRYAECDPMGFAHHSAFPVWLEMGRTELLRISSDLAYRDLEADGILLAVVDLAIRYRRPARYDDVLRITTELTECGPVRVRHEYRLERDGELLATAATTLACLDRRGNLVPVPDRLRPAAPEPDAG